MWVVGLQNSGNATSRITLNFNTHLGWPKGSVATAVPIWEDAVGGEGRASVQMSGRAMGELSASVPPHGIYAIELTHGAR